MMFKPKYIVILAGLFCIIVAGGTLHFYLFFFSVTNLARVDFFGMTTLAFGLASQVQAKNAYFFLIGRTSYGKVMPLFSILQ